MNKDDTVISEAAAAVGILDTGSDATDSLQVYEIGYHILPTVKEEDLEGVLGTLRSAIEKEGGTFIAEGAPAMTRLAYAMAIREGEKYAEYDRAFFGWIKFEAVPAAVNALSESLKSNGKFLRYMIWKTIREDTRAKMKAPTLREIKRTDTIKSARPQKTGESTAPVSEVDLEKALQEITTE